MKLFRLISSGLALAIVSALILPLRCIATGGSNRAGTSSSRTPGGAVTDADKFFQQLVSDHFQRMDQTIQDQPHFRPYPTIPFLHGLPIFTPTANVKVAGQALQDYRSILVVEPNKKEGFKVRISGLYLGKDAIEESNLKKTQFLLSLPEGAHILQKHFARKPFNSNYPIPLPKWEETIHLPHYNGMPIITAGSETDTLGHMRKAAYESPFGFYYERYPHPPVLILPRSDEDIGYTSSKQTLAEIHTIKPEHKRAEKKFGKELAAILYGPSIPVDSRFQESREVWRELPRYAPGENYETMAESLQKYGRFQFDVPGRGAISSYVVELLNPNDHDQTPMEIRMRPLPETEEGGKSLLSGVARAHPPI
ncbi:uncharacterized protein UTRI_04534_B [Ustilago trichophora]|uniref:Effector family protein Eff1 n=1 Tax=Ustilago trichophora TaxID=86804 RepID=A0A5C3EBW8_9BASI|nr:uncharacterized protein UTRI_04534_B [Ustilago trichophora]